MRIFVVDNGGQWTHREWRVLKYLGMETEIIPNSSPYEDLDVDGLVLSGGAPRVGLDTEKMGRNGEYLEKAVFPILGICAGHQFMAIYFGGKAEPAGIPEFGKTQVVVDEEDELFVDLPVSFQAWLSHNDEVSELPQDFISLAHSNNCKHQAMKHTKRPLYGVQFHPEVEHTEHGYEIFKNFLKVCEEMR
ncbi:MAG: GMP synthase subunit A [Methanobacteriota archaeon]|nr:MAG: GMP synthase subunit A [Euryarchaeota archaeon]